MPCISYSLRYLFSSCLDPNFLDSPTSLIVASQFAEVVSLNWPLKNSHFSSLEPCREGPCVLSSAIKKFAELYSADKQDSFLKGLWPRKHLLFLIVGSSPTDDNLGRIEVLREKCKLFGIVLVDLCGHFQKRYGSAVEELFDYIVRYPYSKLKQSDLNNLFGWVPNCLHGFIMHNYEGHHPNEPTFLKDPPQPFGFMNVILKRKIEFWGPLGDEHIESVEG
jgi:hypothetical protein